MGAGEEALAVWLAARVAEGKQPDAHRIERVRKKLADVDALFVVIERDRRMCPWCSYIQRIKGAA